jgi:hypothetical protein
MTAEGGGGGGGDERGDERQVRKDLGWRGERGGGRDRSTGEEGKAANECQQRGCRGEREVLFDFAGFIFA